MKYMIIIYGQPGAAGVLPPEVAQRAIAAQDVFKLI